MSNTNGLLGITSVANTGAVNANIWARKNAPSIVSPITVVSPDGTDIGTISESDTGVMQIGTASGEIVIQSTDPTVNTNFLLSVGDQMELVGANFATLRCYNSGTNLVVGTDAVITKASGGTGIIYDTVYNPVATVIPTIYTSGTTLAAGSLNGAINAGVLAAGLYMLQAKILIDTSSGSYTPGTSINVYVEDFPPSPRTYLPWSSIDIAPGAISAPSGAEGTNVDCTFTSAVFSVPSGKTHWNYFVEAVGSWSFGAGNLSLQLVKLG
jgi:hypothetical protein